MHYEKPGKPKRETPPSRITYHPQASLTPNASLVALHQQRAGRFILATNGVEGTEQLSPQQALEEYKGQQEDRAWLSVSQRPFVLYV